jgi:hypothetical protein
MKRLTTAIVATLLIGLSAAHELPADSDGASLKAGAASMVRPTAPFGLTALLETAKAAGWGMYDARKTHHVKVGETVYLYLEPTGYKYRHENDMFTFGFSLDLRLTHDGKTVFSKDNFFDVDRSSHHANAEFFMDADLDLGQTPPGDYVIDVVLHDHSADQVARAQVLFTID